MAMLNQTAAKMHAKSVEHRPATAGNKNVVTRARSAEKPLGQINALSQKVLRGPGNDGC